MTKASYKKEVHSFGRVLWVSPNIFLKIASFFPAHCIHLKIYKYMQKLYKAVIRKWHKKHIQELIWGWKYLITEYPFIQPSPLHFILYPNQWFLPILNIHKVCLVDPDILGSDDGGETKFKIFGKFFLMCLYY